ncbi:MAG: hypothetical protein ACYTFK_05965 [Planctomycetota bacterium]|jgi:hypothetical protein
MMRNKKSNWAKITLRSLEEQLHQLPQPQTPETLKARLFATIPEHPPQMNPAQQLKWRFQIRKFAATAAAAVLIFAFMFSVNHVLSVPPNGLLTELEDISLNYIAQQQYFLYDQSDAPLAVTLLPDMQKMINPNDIGY